MKKAIPIGVNSYQKLREEEYYTVDKSMMIAEFLERKTTVTLITRPRRFGKTINMSRRCPPLVCLRIFLILQKIPEIYLRILQLCRRNMRMSSIHIQQFFFPSLMQKGIKTI